MVDDAELRQILLSSRRIAVVGMSKNPEKDAHQVPLYLLHHGYDVVPVNPTTDEIAGIRAYPRLSEVPGDYEVVVVFRPSADVPPIVDEAIHAGKAKVIWTQLGIRNEDAARRAESAGLTMVQDLCIRTEHRRLIR